MLEIGLGFVVALALVVYVMAKYQASENSDYAGFVSEAKSLRDENKTMKKRLDEIETLSKDAIAKATEADRAVDHFQEHLASVRESNIAVKNMLASKRPIVRFQNPVPVTIQEKPSTSKMFKKTKKQLDELSK